MSTGAANRRYASPEEAFLARTEPLLWSGCLIWTGCTTAKGYGQISVGGKVVYAHRYAWEQENGPIPEGMQVDHRYHCDPACCEVPHLRLATHAQNQQNRSGRRRGRLLPRGVYPDGLRFRAEVGSRHVGTYKTPAEAGAAADAARREQYGEFAGKG